MLICGESNQSKKKRKTKEQEILMEDGPRDPWARNFLGSRFLIGLPGHGRPAPCHVLCHPLGGSAGGLGLPRP